MLAHLNDAEIFLNPDDDPPNRRTRAKRRQRIERLRPLPEAYVRVPIQWLRKPCRKHVFSPEARLFLYVLYRSHWGQRGVALTNAVAAEIEVPERTKRDLLDRLERKGWVRVERHSGRAPVVWPLVGGMIMSR